MGLAQSYAPLVVYCHDAPRDAVPKIRAAAQQALEIDPGLMEVRTALAGARFFHEWDLERAEQEVRAVIALNPASRWSLQVLSEMLTVQSRFAEAAEVATQALNVDPLALNVNALHGHDPLLRTAIRRCHRSCAQNHRDGSELLPGHFWLGMAHQLDGRVAEAAAALQHARALSTDSTLMAASLGAALAAWGKEQQARDILRQLAGLRPASYVSQVAVAAVWAALGETDRALTSLEEAYTDRCYWLLSGLMVDPRFDPLRPLPRFADLVRRVRAFSERS